MMNNVTIRFAASSLVIGLMMVGCTSADTHRPNNLAAGSAKAGRQANQYYAQAQEAARKGLLSDALGFAERAVELSPRDLGYRMLLGDLYLKNGRFRSADMAFGDVLTLDPGNSRAAFNRALAQIGVGDHGRALAQLDILAATAAPGDLGLAYALAGQPRRAVEMLENAARAPGADGRVRQNLALAYALSGDWQKARVTAAQDVSPADLDARLRQWANFANPSATTDQLASLLGVTPVADAGQPIRLALAPAQAETAAFAAVQSEAVVEAEATLAAVEAPAPVEVAAVEAPAPVQVPEAQVAVLAPAQVQAPAEIESEPQPVYAAAVEALVTPQPAVIRAAKFNIDTSAPTFASRANTKAAKPRLARAGVGRFAVQIGAYGSAAAVERAWAQAYRRYGFGDHQPLSTTIGIPGKGIFHRLSVAGFQTHADASRTCQSVKAKGGACFVRSVAGDAPVRWASRYTRRA